MITISNFSSNYQSNFAKHSIILSDLWMEALIRMAVTCRFGIITCF